MEREEGRASSASGLRRFLWFCAYYGISLTIFAIGVYVLRILLGR